MNKFLLSLVLLTFGQRVIAQTEQKVPETVITSNRIDLPFSKTTHTISLITNEEIENSSASNVADLLQQVTGVDVRRRGIEGMQADVYIRGGSFDQVLVLIDGISTADPQTGHHTMNIMPSMENIERIEIIKGPAARIYGQNAFTGAINIVTKENLESNLTIKGGIGSFGRLNGEITGVLDLKPVSFQAHYAKNYSEGYRFNTDFDNDNFFLKTSIKTKQNPINVLATFSERKFGANGFYASPKYIDQYEETQASLVGVSTKIKKGNWTFKPQVYWKRNQDNYFFLRENPSYFENFHISNRVGGALNIKVKSKIGTTGGGVELAQTYLSSNNLGKRQRFTANLFLEHRIDLFNNKLNITPGVAVSYFTDFKFHAFPGLDVGYKINDIMRVYGNIGYTYRIPTYTDLYYNSPTTLGNVDLKPETALAEELGFVLTHKKFEFTLAGFNRSAKNLIDFTKENEADAFSANNLRAVNTLGFETNVAYAFKLFKQNQRVQLGYNFMNDDIKGLEVPFSRYTLNSAKHHVTGSLDFSFMENITHFVSYKFVERADGTSYNVLDGKISFKIKQVEFSAVINNILDAEYSETNLVPMPERNFMFSLKYSLK
jgi:vitamin B12 transporter